MNQLSAIIFCLTFLLRKEELKLLFCLEDPRRLSYSVAGNYEYPRNIVNTSGSNILRTETAELLLAPKVIKNKSEISTKKLDKYLRRNVASRKRTFLLNLGSVLQRKQVWCKRLLQTMNVFRQWIWFKR